MKVARVNLSVRHPQRGYPMAIVEVDAKGQRAKCPWVDKHGKLHKDWFALKDLGLAAAKR